MSRFFRIWTEIHWYTNQRMVRRLKLFPAAKRKLSTGPCQASLHINSFTMEGINIEFSSEIRRACGVANQNSRNAFSIRVFSPVTNNVDTFEESKQIYPNRLPDGVDRASKRSLCVMHRFSWNCILCSGSALVPITFLSLSTNEDFQIHSQPYHTNKYSFQLLNSND